MGAAPARRRWKVSFCRYQADGGSGSGRDAGFQPQLRPSSASSLFTVTPPWACISSMVPL